MIGELIGALAEFLAQTVNPFARRSKRGAERRRGRGYRRGTSSGGKAGS